ncbi:MAG: UxaA family hydrolase [Archaeoglobi archaeon]|nr:UxaA family hydrolase [Candidatus Mnemosynella sp.]
MNSFEGFEREDGSFGIRNHVAIIPSVICSAVVSRRIAESVKGVVAISHDCGCAQVGKDREQTFRVLSGLGKNPNVHSALIISLGCETIDAQKLADEIAKTGKEVEVIVIQEEGGTPRAIEKGMRIARKMSEEASKQRRKSADISELVVSTECGGSDWTSGIAANPSVGVAMDMVVEAGGTVILSETTEFIGAEHLLARRGASPEISESILEIVRRYEEEAMKMGEDIRGGNPSPGNIKGGLTTIEEKSLGAIHKGGHSKIVEVIEYGERPRKKGLVIMNTPGYDVESVTGMVAGGSQIVVFTTGRGSPTGNPIAPVIKVTGNPRTYEKMKDNIDINAGKVLEGASISEVGREIFEEILKVSSGKLTKAEILGHDEIGIWRIGWSL